MKFTAKEKPFAGKLLGAGLHLAVVSSIAEDKPSHSSEMPWVDITPQVKVTVKNEEGFISHWFNLRGYKSIADYPDGVAPKGYEFMSSSFGEEQYLVNTKTKERVESPEKTEKAVAGLLDFAVQCGIGSGEDFELSDLAGKTVGVMVRETGDDKVEVHYFTKASHVKEQELETA